MSETRIFLIHGWWSSPHNDWLPWAIKELEGSGYEVIVPSMPDTGHPKIKPWVDTLSQLVGTPRATDIFIGHSVGTQAILRYLATITSSVDKVILVAPWLTLTNLGPDEPYEVIESWITTPIDFDKIRSKAKRFTVILSEDDPWVPYAATKDSFAQLLTTNIITFPHHSHFHEDAGHTTFPELIDREF